MSRTWLSAGAGPLLKGLWVFLLIAIAARSLSLPEFSDFSFWLTVSIVLGLVLDFGQQTALLSRLSWNYRLASPYLKARSGMVLFFVLVLGLISVVVSLSFDLVSAWKWYLLASVVAAAAGTLGILACIPERARKNYKPDAIVGLGEMTAATMGVVLLTSTGSWSGLTFIGVYALARIGGLVIGLCVLGQARRSIRSFRFPRMQIVRAWVPFFVHLLFATLILNVDLLLGRIALSDEQYAMYQGGMRLVHAGNLALTVVINVLMPHWNTLDKTGDFGTANAAFIRTAVAFGCVSIAVMPILYFFGEGIVTTIYGVGFTPLAPYLPFFGLIVAVRLLGATVGVLLTNRRGQLIRTKTSVVAVVALVLLVTPWLGSYSMSYLLSCQLVVHLGMNIYLAMRLREFWVNTR